ncbi:MAG TPA: secretin N-terminal domain-containing protein [Verrucomicrobiae bacterium]|nr:secretin N-terminal domain-containing protein [Verrucomicrobiae bacterium]
MKTTTLALLLIFLTGLDLWAQQNPFGQRRLPQRLNPTANSPVTNAVAVPPSVTPSFPAPAPTATTTPAPGNLSFSSPDNGAAAVNPNSSNGPEVPAYTYNFQGVDVSQVLDVYAQLVGRTVLRAGLPTAQIILKTETLLTKSEAIQALQAVLALNGVSLINMDDKFVKAIPADQAGTAGGAFSTNNAEQMPGLGSYVTRIVQLKYTKPSDMVTVIKPFAKLADSIVPIDSNGILVLRDNAENVKRMMEMINQVDVTGSASQIISEVIPIKYAMVDDIANALNSLGGQSSAIGNATTPGSSGSRNAGNGFSNSGNSGGGLQGQQGQNRPYGSTTTTGGTTGTAGNNFSSNLQRIIQRAASGSSSDQIQIFGQTKIIADERSNSLLVFATRTDMDTITNIVAKLDVLLAQVLIESVIMDVDMGKALSYGVSVAQNQKGVSSNPNVQTAGGYNNGQPFFSFLNSDTNGFPGNFTSVLPSPTTLSGIPMGQFSYFGNIGPTWDAALQAAAGDSSIKIIQRPRIQTSQAKEASFFVGETVPYVTSVYYDSGIGGGPSSSYSQLSVGVELDVTPFINPDGLVVMDINQEIDDISGSTPISGVGNVPNTNKRTLSSEIAVRDKDTIILGGFVKSEHDKSRAGVPILQDIPLLGALFSSRSSANTREELLVLMRPTVLKTPEIAAAQVAVEEKRLPGVTSVEREDEEQERSLINANQKLQQQNLKHNPSNSDFFQQASPTVVPKANSDDSGLLNP